MHNEKMFFKVIKAKVMTNLTFQLDSLSYGRDLVYSVYCKSTENHECVKKIQLKSIQYLQLEVMWSVITLLERQ